MKKIVDIIRPNYELYILQIIFEEKSIHGLRIANELRDRSDNKIKITAGTLYTILHRLERKAYIGSKWENQSKNELGRPRRKYYFIKGDGLCLLRESTHLMRSFFKLDTTKSPTYTM